MVRSNSTIVAVNHLIYITMYKLTGEIVFILLFFVDGSIIMLAQDGFDY